MLENDEKWWIKPEYIIIKENNYFNEDLIIDRI